MDIISLPKASARIREIKFKRLDTKTRSFPPGKGISQEYLKE